MYGGSVRIIHVEDGKTDGLPEGVAEALKEGGCVRRGFGTLYVTTAFWNALKRRVPEAKTKS